jgi:hypothetical protein
MYHFPTQFCAPTTFCGARSAQSMMRGVLFTDLGTCVTDIGAEAAQSITHRGASTHPLAGQHTDIRALAAQPNTLCHELLITMMVHADHVVAAGLASLGTGETGGNTFLIMLCLGQTIFRHTHLRFPC